MKKIYFILILLLVLACGYIVLKNFDVAVQGPASDSLVFIPLSGDNATELLLSGGIDMYMAPLTSEQANKLKESNINIYTSPSSKRLSAPTRI